MDITEFLLLFLLLLLLLLLSVESGWSQVQSRLKGLEEIRKGFQKENLELSQRHEHLANLHQMGAAQADLEAKTRAVVAVANDIQVGQH